MTTDHRVRPHLPLSMLPSLTRSLLRGQRRCFRGDCQAMLGRCPHRWENLNVVPDRGPLCVLANHYQRRDLWIGWTGALISVGVAKRRSGQVPHWLVLGDLRVPIGPWHLPLPGAREIFGRVAEIWGMVPLAGPDHPTARAQAIRTLFAYLQRSESIGLFPEGDAGRAGSLGPAQPGVGRFVERLWRQEVPVVPVGIREVDGVLVARFGEPLAGLDHLDLDGDRDRDEVVGRLIMDRIRQLTTDDASIATRHA